MKDEFGNSSRRNFLRKATWLAVGAPLVSWPVAAKGKGGSRKLTILHTNDTHSQMEPFAANHPRYAGMGGIARRAALIKEIRQQEQNVLLLDSGDIYQGTPYFNLFGGSVEFKAMSMLGYDAATMGNHDFDIGLDGFLRNLPDASFPFICSNYDFTNTILNGRTITHRVFVKGGIRIGVFALGIELSGLVDRPLYGETRYLDPVERATDMVRLLREEQKCDYIICLSHLGYQYATLPAKINDIELAKKTSGIDLILGGHTHTFLDEPVAYTNMAGQLVLVAQTGFGGIRLGRIDVYFDERKRSRHQRSSPITVK